MNATCDGATLKPDPIPVTPVLTAAFTNHPSPIILLSWNTIPFSSNYLYTAPSLLLSPTNWQLVTNFFSDGGRVTVADPIKTTGAHYYRVRALSP